MTVQEQITHTCGKHSHARLTHAHIVHRWYGAQLSLKAGSQRWVASISQCVVISQRFGLVFQSVAEDSEVSSMLFFFFFQRAAESRGAHMSRPSRDSESFLTLAGPELSSETVICSSGRSASACPCMPQTSAVSIRLSHRRQCDFAGSKRLKMLEKWSSCASHSGWEWKWWCCVIGVDYMLLMYRERGAFWPLLLNTGARTVCRSETQHQHTQCICNLYSQVFIAYAYLCAHTHTAFTY